MTKISFCGISGSGMSALAQIRLHQGYEVRGSDRSFDQGKDQSNKQALEKLGIKIYPQDGSAITDDLDVLYVSTAVEDTIPDVKAALGKIFPFANAPICWPTFSTVMATTSPSAEPAAKPPLPQ